MSSPLKIIFAGTPDFAARHLQGLLDSNHEVVAVYCPIDKPAGRGKKLTPCAVKQLALQHQIPVEQPVNFKATSDQQTLASYDADIMVVVAYGLLLPKVVLDTPRLGCINVHGSILPRWRGAAPIQRAVEAGDPQTGVTIMQMDEGLDTGDMIATAICDIASDETSSSLYEKLAVLGPKALVETLDLIAGQQASATPQDDKQATYAHKLSKDEAILDWQQNAAVLERKIRAYQPWPFAQIHLEDDKQQIQRIKIWQAHISEGKPGTAAGTILAADKHGIVVQCADQALCLTQLQAPGKKPMSVADILNGRAEWFVPGTPITGKK
ncbi:methionyl-tRNA formyltransferase [Thalassotalea mangrovi]|uniref:Methionyl-tRNA formyltransferase n=1 Tax=Thalassotalea mangrovi TaxID=2572245 RepID=A0A4U1B764_9GAMM|nr:methionyl-tRNA formyltransferase [Thalassotalea mangrovi]TKB46424.1 methionyl-tRNA formyltransferase [Thalassotalea mangrovi]